MFTSATTRTGNSSQFGYPPSVDAQARGLYHAAIPPQERRSP